MKCSTCWDAESPLYPTSFEPTRMQCAECMRSMLFRYRLALHQISIRQCSCALPACMHQVAVDALRDR